MRRPSVGSSAQTPKRPLSAPERAFVRSWAEGLDLVAAWHRYLRRDGDAAIDSRQARLELRRLLERLQAQARSRGRPDQAALLRRDPEAIPDGGPPLPSLAEFAAQQPPDYYSEAELLRLYRETHGRDRRADAAARRSRLRSRLLEAIEALGQGTETPPAPEDPTTRWIDTAIADRLARVGIRTLADLHAYVRQRGFHWHRRVPRLGPRGAARLVDWLREHAAQLGPLPAAVLRPARQRALLDEAPAPATAIAPLERFVPPAGCDGRDARNRAPRARCRIPAADDIAAVGAWLDTHRPGSHTWRAYRREAERFLLWAALERRRALSGLEGADCAAYLDFLRAPGPAWTGPRNQPRHTAGWRPFEGPLAERSRATSRAILQAMGRWLVRQRYWIENPWDDLPGPDQPGDAAARPDPAPPDAPPAARPTVPTAFDRLEWAKLRHWVDAEQRNAPTAVHLLRLRVLLEMPAATGLRLSELADARLGWLRRDPAAEAGWTLAVPSAPGRAARQLPLPAVALDALAAYLQTRGSRSEEPDGHPDDAPLVSHLAHEQPLSAARIHDILKAGFARCAAALVAREPAVAERVRHASARWLRHTYGRQAISQGLPQHQLQARLGHASPAATARYRPLD